MPVPGFSTTRKHALTTGSGGGPEEGQYPPNRPTGPIITAWWPLSAYLSHKHKRRVTDNEGVTADPPRTELRL
jgi:hypothetical protein